MAIAAVGAALVLRPAGDEIAAAAPTFEAPDLRAPERNVSLGDFDDRPVVVNFFAAWCVPCREELPDLVAAADEYEGRVAFVGIDYQDSRNQALDLLEEFAVRYPAVYDPQGRIGASYGVRGMPLTVFLDRDHRIVRRVDGRVDAETLRDGIAELLEGAPDASAARS